VDSSRSRFKLEVVFQAAVFMSQAIHLELELPDDLARLRLPEGVQQRLTELLNKQDEGEPLTNAERQEAEGLVDLAELLSLLRMRSDRMSTQRA
jgi:hypothetical protein